MTVKQVVPREVACRDVEAAVDFYASEAGQAVALRFIDAVETAYRALGSHPAADSPRFGYELDLPGLRTRLLKGYPYLIFYFEGDHVDVWRVLHAQRDIPAWLLEPQT